jgi:superfamily II DNA helicase RecQ
VVRRSIIDEVHVLFTEGGNFRKCLDGIPWITELNIPIFGLTTTFPSYLERELQLRFAIVDQLDMTTIRSAPSIIRFPTERAAISYNVRFLTDMQQIFSNLKRRAESIFL